MAYVQEALGWLPRHDPLGQDRLKEDLVEEAGGEAIETAAPAERKPLVVFADDNADMREYVTNLLGWKHEVIPAANGKQALETAMRTSPDLVVTDVMMPEMDGFALLEALRRNPSTRIVPVIMLSARAGEEASIGGLEAGADDYLTKPFSARELVARVEAQIKMSQLRREIGEARQFAWEALEHLPDAFCTFDSAYRVTFMNRAATAITAQSEQQHLGKSLWELYPMLLETFVVETHLRNAMEERVQVEFEHYFQGDDVDRWYKFLLYPHHEGGLILYLRDTTRATNGASTARLGTAGGRGKAGCEHRARDQQPAGSSDEPAVSRQDG